MRNAYLDTSKSASDQLDRENARFSVLPGFPSGPRGGGNGPPEVLKIAAPRWKRGRRLCSRRTAAVESCAGQDAAERGEAGTHRDEALRALQKMKTRPRKRNRRTSPMTLKPPTTPQNWRVCPAAGQAHEMSRTTSVQRLSVTFFSTSGCVAGLSAWFHLDGRLGRGNQRPRQYDGGV